jgi:hypothetical protein
MPRESGHLRCDGCGAATTERPGHGWLLLSDGSRAFCLDCVTKIESGEVDELAHTFVSTCDRCGTTDSDKWSTTRGDDGRVIQVCGACRRLDDPHPDPL